MPWYEYSDSFYISINLTMDSFINQWISIYPSINQHDKCLSVPLSQFWSHFSYWDSESQPDSSSWYNWTTTKICTCPYTCSWFIHPITTINRFTKPTPSNLSAPPKASSNHRNRIISLRWWYIWTGRTRKWLVESFSLIRVFLFFGCCLFHHNWQLKTTGNQNLATESHFQINAMDIVYGKSWGQLAVKYSWHALSNRCQAISHYH